MLISSESCISSWRWNFVKYVLLARNAEILFFLLCFCSAGIAYLCLRALFFHFPPLAPLLPPIFVCFEIFSRFTMPLCFPFQRADDATAKRSSAVCLAMCGRQKKKKGIFLTFSIVHDIKVLNLTATWFFSFCVFGLFAVLMTLGLNFAEVRRSRNQHSKVAPHFPKSLKLKCQYLNLRSKYLEFRFQIGRTKSSIERATPKRPTTFNQPSFFALLSQEIAHTPRCTNCISQPGRLPAAIACSLNDSRRLHFYASLF